MWQRKFKLILVSIISFIGLTACTPYEQAIWNSLSPDQQQAVIANVSDSSAVCSGNKNIANCNIGWDLAKQAGYSQNDFACLDYVIMRESSWYNVPNAAGGSAYGVPQALPGSKMSSHGSDWRTNPATQIRWLLDYVDERYGSPCKAKAFKSQRGWY